MPKTKNVSRARWDHATRATAAAVSNDNTLTALSNNNDHNILATTTTTLATALSPPARMRPHATRTTSTMSATATRGTHRRAKENSENATSGGEKENTGRLGRSTRTHITPGLSVAVLGSTNLPTSTSKTAKPTPKPAKPTKLRVKKQPLQDVTAQFVASGMGEGANRAGTDYALLGEEDIVALRAEQGNSVVARPPTPDRVATPAQQRTSQEGAARQRHAEPTSPLPPSSPPSDYRLPATLELDLALRPLVPLKAGAREASPAPSIPVPEYDGWASFDSARPVGSPTQPVAVRKEEPTNEDDQKDREDPFGFAALERKLKAGRAQKALNQHDDGAHQAAEQEDEEEDIDNIPVADTSSPRPDGLRRTGSRNTLKRALEEEMDDEEDAERAALARSPAPALPTLLSSPVRAAVIAAATAATPLSTPAPAVEASPEHPHAHAHFATPPTPHKDGHRKRRRISALPHPDADAGHDVFGPCVQTGSNADSSSSPGKIEAESPSPSKSTRKALAKAQDQDRLRALAAHEDGGAPSVARAGDGDALDAFNAALDAQEATASAAAGVADGDAKEEGADVNGGRTLRPRASRATLAAHGDASASAKENTAKPRSASRGRGRGTSRGRGLGRGASRGTSKSRGRGRGVSRAKAKEGREDADPDVEEQDQVDQDEKFEQERQARIAYFRGLDAYEVETEDVVVI